MTLQTQRELEERMITGGIARSISAMNKAEDQGRAHQNPYAKELFNEYVLPLAESIKAAIASSDPSRHRAHISLLLGLDPEAVAFLAIRYALSSVLSPKGLNHRQLASRIGLSIYHELVLIQIEMQAPDLYETLVKDFDRKLSKDERHRMVVFMQQAKKANLTIANWTTGSKEQVGMFLMELMIDAGLISLGAEFKIAGTHRSSAREVFVSAEVLDYIDKIKSFTAATLPYFGPCVERPLDWGFGVRGGWHTPALQKAAGGLVHARRSARKLADATDMPVVYAAVNALQSTAWAINVRILNTIYAVAKEFSTKEIVSLADTPAPTRPEWLKEDWTKAPRDEWPTDKLAEFKMWKHDMAEWHTQRKLIGSRYARFYAATRTAEQYRDYKAIYFVYFADSRGRLYPITSGVSPQGSDLSKALLHFAEGKPLNTPDAIKWFYVQGANKWGFDKATLADRAAWVLERDDLICSFAADPVNNQGWTEAGDPLQFLAWCFEYADYKANPAGFLSHLPISMDGSCNGLQNLSAMFRDEIGGAATNLTNNVVMRDIYADVAAAATKRLLAKELEGAEAAMRDKWVAHGISRKAVKRSVMTTPYGVTERTATQYIIDDYLRENLGPTFDKTEYRRAAILLMSAVWPAIGDVVVKGREAMDWLRKSARKIIKAGSETIAWDTPSGFPASQDYYETVVHRIRTHLHGPLKLRVEAESDIPDVSRHASGLAPNFVHSLDAAHLHLTTADAAKQGISALAMIHDDYGTHAADAQLLFDTIRKQFVAMYLACDPAAQLRERYPFLTPPPSHGTLDIMEVLESDFFFS